jgi:membrane associated rhomboid family serine protease
MTAAIKMLIGVNVAMFILNIIVPAMTLRLGLVPAAVLGEFALWQPVTYMFLHDTEGWVIC